MRFDDPRPRPPAAAASVKPTMRERIDRELRPVARVAVLGDRALPTRTWRDMTRGRTRPMGILPELALAARLHGRCSAHDLRAGLHVLADVTADQVERALADAA